LVLRSTLPHLRRRLRARGFTLIEMLAVLAMISLLVVLASPSFVRVLRDRRVNRAAMQLVDYFRTARTQAIGRGQPMLVTYNLVGNPATHPGGTGRVTLDEPIVTNIATDTQTAGAAAPGPAPTCNQTLWGNPTYTQQLAAFDIQNGLYDYTNLTFFDDVGAKTTYVEVCFSNTGRMWLREGASPPLDTAFHLVTGVPYFYVQNFDPSTGIKQGPDRWVLVPPNGMARMKL
jgi:type IV fimbrial biogenesis protein FimT